MSSVRKVGRGLGSLSRELRKLKGQSLMTVRIKAAEAAAVALSAIMLSDFDSGRTIYGGARPLGVRGNQLSLVASGDTRAQMRFVSDGTTRIRVSLTRDYHRYLIGKYSVLPSGQQAIPAHWLPTFRETIQKVLTENVMRGAA